MKILFVVAKIYMSEPLGVMQLISICKKEGHLVKLIDLRRHNLIKEIISWEPCIIAYNTLAADFEMYKKNDLLVKAFMKKSGKKYFRVMGGAHPTFTPNVIEEMGLDAICIGEGDYSLPTLLKRLKSNKPIEDIPNIALSKDGPQKKELIHDLDGLPYLDRKEMFSVTPYYQQCGLRSFYASRGCPYHCTYCFNESFNKIFKGCGEIVRRRSVDNLISEIEYVIKNYPPVKIIRFNDDTFVHKADEWLEEFTEKYISRIKLPFYCLMRSNTLTEKTAYLLSKAGCYSISMSLETGSEIVRNKILKRNLSDKLVIESFKIAAKYGIKTYANTMLGIPGTKLENDFESLEFARIIRPTVPTFGICVPYKGTAIWKFAVDKGLINDMQKVNQVYRELSVLNNFTDKEKKIQARIAFLGTIFCKVPKAFLPLMYKVIKSNVSFRICYYLGRGFTFFKLATKIFPQSIPRTPKTLLRVIRDTFK